MRWIPLWGRDGVIRDWTCVDDDDFDRLNAFRWFLTNGYAVRSSAQDDLGQRRSIRMHREITGLVRGDGLEVDHRDRTAKLDNRRSNLRVGTKAQNQQNRATEGCRPWHGRPTSSRFRGVSWIRDLHRWAAYATVDGKRHYLGSFLDEEEAGRAAAAGRAQLMPFSVEGPRG